MIMRRDRTYLGKRGFSDDQIRDEFEQLLSALGDGDNDLLDQIETRDLSDAEFLARDDENELSDLLLD
jgi:hypothetical protein